MYACTIIKTSFINRINGENTGQVMKLRFGQTIPVIISFHLGENTKQRQSTFPSVPYKLHCHVVRLSSVATWFSVNLYQCGLDPQGRDSLASMPAMDQQTFLCTPSGSVSTGRLRTGASLDLRCQGTFRKVAQDTNLTGNAKMPKHSQLFNHGYLT